MLKISLGLAILVGLLTLYVSHFQVSEKITTLRTDLETTQQNLTTSQANETKAKAEAKKVREELAKTERTLQETAANLETVTARATEQEKRANQLAQDLEKTTRDRNEAQQELASWRTIGLPIDQIKGMRDELSRTREERNVYIAENKILNGQINQLKGRLARYEGPDTEVPLPAGLKGEVVAVDPKWDFVVLNIGGNQGVVENGQMLVNRNGKLVARVKITSVEPNRSIANILPEWKQAEVREGDQVIY